MSMSGVSGSKFLSASSSILLLLLMTKTTCSSFPSRPPPPVQQQAAAAAAETDSENSSCAGAVKTRKKRRKHRRKAARKQQKQAQDAMNFLRRVTFDLMSILQHPNGKTVTNIYVSHPGRHQTVLFTCILLGALTFASSPVGASIDCFKCVSTAGNNPSCEDPFHNNFSSSILETPCMGGRKGRNGLFPATACIKMKGVYWDNGETFIVRGCALDSGTQTTDTEIIRMSHCGGFYYNDRYVRGCLLSCDEADGCNGTTTAGFHMDFTMLSQLCLSIILWYWYFMSLQPF